MQSEERDLGLITQTNDYINYTLRGLEDVKVLKSDREQTWTNLTFKQINATKQCISSSTTESDKRLNQELCDIWTFSVQNESPGGLMLC